MILALAVADPEEMRDSESIWTSNIFEYDIDVLKSTSFPL